MSFQIPDHPVIRNMERTGFPDGKEPATPKCPCCGEECETIYTDRYGAHIGCDICVTTKNAWEVKDCFPEEDAF